MNTRICWYNVSLTLSTAILQVTELLDNTLFETIWTPEFLWRKAIPVLQYFVVAVCAVRCSVVSYVTAAVCCSVTLHRRHTKVCCTHIAACCSVFNSCCSVLQWAAVCCASRVPARCSVLQYTAEFHAHTHHHFHHLATVGVAVCCSVLQHIAACCSVFQPVAAYYGMLQHDSPALSNASPKSARHTLWPLLVKRTFPAFISWWMIPSFCRHSSASRSCRV